MVGGDGMRACENSGVLFLFCFLVRAFKTPTLLANFIYTIVLSTIVTMFCIRSSDLTRHIAESLNSFTSLSYFFHAPSPWKPLFNSLFL